MQWSQDGLLRGVAGTPGRPHARGESGRGPYTHSWKLLKIDHRPEWEYKTIWKVTEEKTQVTLGLAMTF